MTKLNSVKCVKALGCCAVWNKTSGCFTFFVESVYVCELQTTLMQVQVGSPICKHATNCHCQ